MGNERCLPPSWVMGHPVQAMLIRQDRTRQAGGEGHAGSRARQKPRLKGGALCREGQGGGSRDKEVAEEWNLPRHEAPWFVLKTDSLQQSKTTSQAMFVPLP